MPPKNSTSHARPICLCKYYGCERNSFRDEITGIVYRGRQVTRQTLSNHRKKEEEWEAQQNGPPLPGSGPHTSIQNVANVVDNTSTTTKDQPTQPHPVIEGSSTLAQAAPAHLPHTSRNRHAEPRTYLVLSQNPTVAQLQQAILHLVDLVAAWIFVACGLSRAASISLMKLIHSLIRLSIMAGYASAQQQIQPRDAHFTTTYDPRTSIDHLSIDPTLRRSVHCPTCFTWYDGTAFPTLCAFRPTLRSRICATRLLTEVSSHRGTRKIPRLLYTTQDFKSWLEFFLSRPGIEELILKSYVHQPNPHAMVSIWDSPAWQSIRTEDDHPFCTQGGTLTFSFYIDWFNPFLNKIAGRIVSSGAIIFYCLNLPYDSQGLPENVFIAGITPAPKEPSMTTIAHLLDPVVDQFEEMWHGAIIRTYMFPQGTFYRVGVLPGIGDMPGMRKAFSRAGVGSKRHLCSLCKIHKDQIDEIDMLFPPHTSQEIYEAGKKWKDADTQKERKQILDEFGVRWSPMLRLTYRDSVRHTVVGVMHNWIEGIIQHHVRVFWSVGVPSGIKTTTAVQPILSSSEHLQPFQSSVQSGISFYSQALQGFAMDTDQPRRNTNSDDSSSSAAGSLATDINDSADESAEQELADDDPQPRSVKTFTVSQLAAIRACISDAVVPSWLARPPANLGEASHGKLKADEWLVLCTVFLPLILPEIWYEQQFHPLLANFAHLTTCTNILLSHLVTNETADLYTYHYKHYRRSSLQLFPDINTRPNHHFAMHNGELMKYWGPLAKVSEFVGERANGTLQKIQTNRRFRDMDLTMIRQMCRRGRLNALVQRQQLQYADSMLLPQATTGKGEVDATGIFMASLDTLAGTSNLNSIPSRSTTDSHILPPNVYNQLLFYINFQRDVPLCRYDSFPHPTGATVYSHWATPLPSVVIHGRKFTTYTKHRGNSTVYISHPYYPHAQVGFINSIWSQNIEGIRRTFLFVQPPAPLSQDDAARSPYASQELVGIMGVLVYDKAVQDCLVVEPGHVYGHVPYYIRPPGTFGIQQGTMVMLNSLHRYRH